MIISASIISTNTTGASFYPLFVAIVALVIFLMANLDLNNKITVQFLGVLSNAFIAGNLVLDGHLSIYLALPFFLIFSFLYFSDEMLKLKEFRDYILYSTWLGGALLLSYIFIVDSTSFSFGVMIEYSFIILALLLSYLKFRNNDSKFTDLFQDDFSSIGISFAFAIPFNVFLTDLSDQTSKYWIMIITSLIISSYIFYRRDHLKNELSVISYLLLSLPLIFSLSIYQNEVFSSLVIIYSLIVSSFIFISLYEVGKTKSINYLLQTSIHLFLAISVIGKLVTLSSTNIVDDINYGSLLLLFTYFIWVLYILYQFSNLDFSQASLWKSAIIGLGVNYLVFLQIVVSNKIGSSSIVLRGLYFGNQVLILGIIFLVHKRKLVKSADIDRLQILQLSLIGLEIITLLVFNFVEILIYHTILILLVFNDMREVDKFNNPRISVLWLIVNGIAIITYGNYFILSSMVMLLLVYASLLYSLKPRRIIENLANMSLNPTKILFYESSLLIFLYLSLMVFTRLGFPILIGYFLYLLISGMNFRHHALNQSSFTNLVGLNLFVLGQIFWISELLPEDISYHVAHIFTNLMVVIFVIYLERSKLLNRGKVEGRLLYDWPALGVASALILLTLEISYLVSYNLNIVLTTYNQILGLVMLSSSGLLFATQNKIRQSNLIDGLKISTFILGLGLTLFGFFNSVVSNLLISVIVLIFVLGYLITKSTDLLNIAKSLYVISLIKAGFDLILLDSLERGISILAVGINGIFFALILQSSKQEELLIDKEP
ncbi:MAG: hypothetical protein IH840_13210 [Candidatus Heimdallarchaeota archaeon]|nr:hypothetical protein [Candidatus Heimdallarchaeota archaeon]